jgi:PiT family inorganic phosphate transporter
MTILIIAIAVGIYMAWSIGSNDVANAWGTSVAARSVSFKKAVILAAILNILGATLVGTHVANTIRKGIIDPLIYAGTPEILMLGMISSLLAAALWVTSASYLKLPISTTHAIVGAIIGFGIVTQGLGAVNWFKTFLVVISWIISPIFGGIVAWFIFKIIKRFILGVKDPIQSCRKILPFFIALTCFILVLALIYKGLKPLKLNFPFFKALGLAIVIAILGGVIGYILLRYHKERDGLDYVEEIHKPMQVLSASYQSFAHGANDVANAIGPVACIFSIIITHSVKMKVEFPWWLLVIGGCGIALGISTYGRKVMDTIGKRITDITPTRGFSAEFSAATTVLICSKLGLPISTTHVSVGAVIGVGFARGISALNLTVIKNIILSWFVTLPVAGVLSAIIFKCLVYFVN